MLNLAATRIVKSLNRDVATGTEINSEGLALIYVNENGVGKVKPSTGAANERFAGVSQSQTLLPLQAAEIEDRFAKDSAGVSSATITLRHLSPIAGQLRVVETSATTGAVVATYVLNAGAPAAHEFQITGNVVTLNAADAGKHFILYYRYTPSAPEAVELFGVGAVGGVSATAYVTSVGVIYDGDISTSAFDPTDAWENFAPTTDNIRLGANGLFTMKGTGTILTNANLVAAPSVGGNFLTLTVK